MMADTLTGINQVKQINNCIFIRNLKEAERRDDEGKRYFVMNRYQSGSSHTVLDVFVGVIRARRSPLGVTVKGARASRALLQLADVISAALILQ